MADNQEVQSTDFISILMEMRNGQVASDLSAKFNEVLMGVLESGGKGELTVTFLLAPAKMGMGGVVLEVEAEHKAKIKRPELKIGKSVFFVTKQGTLTREDPAQTAMFELQQEEQKKKERTN